MLSLDYNEPFLWAKQIGDITESAIKLRLQRAGLIISETCGDTDRYDFVADDRNSLYRIQCKTGRLKNSSVSFPCASNQGTSKYTIEGNAIKKYTKDQIDYFGVYCRETNDVYLIHIDQVGERTSMSLRLGNPDRKKKNVNWAEDYRVKIWRYSRKRKSKPKPPMSLSSMIGTRHKAESATRPLN